ncbi:hypothetical protein A6U88_03595 [Agrobacterium sp. B131/95]|nr:hypothetical protein A6U88_03595 [Agrobacterium sp. B131/95]
MLKVLMTANGTFEPTIDLQPPARYEHKHSRLTLRTFQARNGSGFNFANSKLRTSIVNDMQVADHLGGMQKPMVPFFMWHPRGSRRNGADVNQRIFTWYRNDPKFLPKLLNCVHRSIQHVADLVR